MVFDTLYFFDLSRGAIVDYRIHIEPFAFNVMFAFLLLGTVKICLLIKIIYVCIFISYPILIGIADWLGIAKAIKCIEV